MPGTPGFGICAQTVLTDVGSVHGFRVPSLLGGQVVKGVEATKVHDRGLGDAVGLALV